MTIAEREADAVKHIIEKLEAIGRQLQAMDYPVVAGHCTTAAYMLGEDRK
jgi:ribosomal protein S12 methylthiotransferase accessory factor YcaO